jgi:dCTP deaminase
MKSGAPEPIFISPLLEESQVGEVSVDVRLGYDFRVSIHSRNPVIRYRDPKSGPIANFFQTTRRDLGHSFMMYPGQLVLATTLEYVAIPSSIMADVLTRSSYSRIGIAVQTALQPGYRGCIPIELHNISNTPIELVVGSRMFQLRFHQVSSTTDYLKNQRKYYGAVRPVLSMVGQDVDLLKLNRLK